MPEEKYNHPTAKTQSIVEVVSISARGRLNNDADSKARAFVDVVLYFVPGGSLTIHGCMVLHEIEKEPRVLLPNRKGEKNRYFPIASASGEIHRLIERAAVDEYTRLVTPQD